MSPIDIVPMAPSPCDEQFRDTSNGVGYRNNGYASGTQRSADGGTRPGYFKPVSLTVTFTVISSEYKM